MTRSSRFGPLPIVLTYALVAACTPHTPQKTVPAQSVAAGDYEFYNPTPCVAVAYTVDQTGLNRTELGHVPSGGRLIIRVPSLPAGARVVAHATAPDGTDCERGYRIVVRRLEPGAGF